MMRRLFTAATIAVALTMPAAAQTPAPTTSVPQPSETPPSHEAAKPAAHLDGFRGAKWGMSEAEVKAVIADEFKIPVDKLGTEVNPAERTTVLPILVPDLIEGAGNARVSYIFGYQTKKLIEVNILWGTPVDPQAKSEMVIAAANQLRDLFATQGYDPATMVTNARASDGSVVVFSGQDADKHTTLLRLVQTQAAPREGRTKPPVSTTLLLSYILDSKNPDIFRLKSGSF